MAEDEMSNAIPIVRSAVIVSGWRGPLSASQVTDVLHGMAPHLKNDITVYDGGARGVDVVIRAFVETQRLLHGKTFKAEWTAYGKSAGPRRNRQMVLHAVDNFNDVTLVAFPHPTDSVGTWDCIKVAVEFGITCHIYPIKIGE